MRVQVILRLSMGKTTGKNFLMSCKTITPHRRGKRKKQGQKEVTKIAQTPQVLCAPVSLNSNYKFSNFVLIRHEKASGANKLVDLAVGGLEFGPKTGFPRGVRKNSGSSTHISPLTQWNSRATVL